MIRSLKLTTCSRHFRDITFGGSGGILEPLLTKRNVNKRFISDLKAERRKEKQGTRAPLKRSDLWCLKGKLDTQGSGLFYRVLLCR